MFTSGELTRVAAHPLYFHRRARVYPERRMTLTDRIEINPRVMLGKPVIRGTRIPVELILRKLSEAHPRPTSSTRILGSHVRTSTRRCVMPPTARFQVDARGILLGAVNGVNL
jgi:Protein of unknown function (DUF433)